MARFFKNKMLITSVIAAILLFATLLLVMISPSFAYFRTQFDKNGYHNMIIELIFDRLDETGMAAYAEKYQEAYGSTFSPNAEATWGSRDNPYVISQKYHIQNLSVLQNTGFFEKRVDESGKTVQAYFLVCNPDGTPVVIDCGGMTISPVGNHKRPFTGVISGAPSTTGESSYKNYGTTVSGIANLTVEATLNDPDIGFFGRLGYYGEKTTEPNGYGVDVSSVKGYAAYVDDLLFADITIKSTKSLSQMLADWWAALTGHLHYADAWKETHHVGIVAGHAEFATLKDVSVYYSSDSVAAFNLVSNEEGSNTNYYSSTGLIGLLDCVNPTINSDGVLDGSDAISDSILMGDGSSGGGGDESGTMTGYFLAKNLYDRHEDYLSEKKLTTKDKYNVSEMKEIVDGKEKSLFKTVTMQEEGIEILGQGIGTVYKNYFYFQDTVFTFAMSMSLKADKNGNTTEEPNENMSDYIQKIWKLDENTPSIPATSTYNDLQYGPAPGAKVQIAYYLKAETSLTEGGYYILTYLDKGANQNSTADDVLYILDLSNPNSDTFAYVVGAGEIYGDPTYNEKGYIDSLYLLSSSPKYYEYSFIYNKKSGYPIQNPEGYSFGISATPGNFTSATTVLDNSSTSSGGILGWETAFEYDWDFKPASSDKDECRVSVTGVQSFGGFLSDKGYGWSKLQFSEGKINFYTKMTTNESTKDDPIPFNDDGSNYFTVFEVNLNTYEDNNENGNINNTKSTENIQLTPMNITPGNELYNFDPSKYVLQFVDGKENDSSDDSYKLLPIRSLKLNNGQGSLLTDINHIAKLYRTHNQNYQLDIGFIKHNSGGVLSTTIGTTDDEIYAIPTGMIAFEINEASEEKPSYINIIVAVNPEQTMIGTIGLWELQKSAWSEFDISEPDDSFELPISKTAKDSSDSKYIIKVSERVVESESEGKKTYTTVTDSQGNNEISYVYIGGETVLVYHTFKVTSKGVYMIGSKAGPLSVAYFSVTGAAGVGDDGMSGSPLGNIDFVYDYDGKIITTDKYYTGETPLADLEDYNNYYPSYLFVGMLPKDNKIQYEVVNIRRYIKNDDAFGTRRHLTMSGENYTAIRSASPIMEDYQDDIDGG